MRPPEYWLVRVLVKFGRYAPGHRLAGNRVPPGEAIAIVGAVERGELLPLPDGSIAEPMESFATEALAQAARMSYEALAQGGAWREPRADLRVVLNADC